MKRARRGIVLGVLALLGGAVVTSLVANAIGALGVANKPGGTRQLYVAVAGMYIFVQDTPGIGWRDLYWGVYDPEFAPTAQYMKEHNLSTFNGRVDPSLLHVDAPDSLPQWSRMWRSDQWPPLEGPGGVRPGPFVVELAVGWPMQAFAMDSDNPVAGPWHGGMTVGKPLLPGLRVIAWRPIWPGFAADTLLYAACLAALAAGGRLFVRARRRRRGACAGCGYDLKGLANGAACPECGAGGFA